MIYKRSLGVAFFVRLCVNNAQAMHKVPKPLPLHRFSEITSLRDPMHMSNIPIIKQVPPDEIEGKALFAGSDGKFYNKSGKQLKHAFCKAKRIRNNRRSGAVYPYMVNYRAYCHRLIGRTFLRKLRKGEVYDHINGDITNYSVANLRIVKKANNDRDAGFLKKLRNKGIDPRMYA